ncbi:MAG: hypothetical protein H7Y88_07685 [Phycisphaerales bacterium]|nr:hypothetical protein [Phycisphaerales bacterium]
MPNAAGPHDHEKEAFQPAAMVLAFLLPGAGHYALGEVRRAFLICAGVLGLFFGGILLGGIDSVDRKDDFIWFMGQSLVGPVAFGIDYLHQSQFKVVEPRTGVRRTAIPGESRGYSGEPVQGGSPPNTKSLGRVNELGTLFSTVAGMMNLLCIIDAASYRPRKRNRPGGVIGRLEAGR